MKPLLLELLSATERDGFDSAAARFCETHRCGRPGNATDSTLFLDVPSGATVLQLGAGAGDDTLRLAARAAETIAGVTDAHHAALIERRAREAGVAVRPLVLEDLSRLPLEAGSVQAVAVDELSATAFGLSQSTLISAAREWRRVLSSGGSLLFTSSNPLFRLPGVGQLWEALRARSTPESLDRVVRRAQADGRRPDFGLSATLDTLCGQGFVDPALFAPLPDARRPLAVLPVEEPRVARYFLTHLVRRNSGWSRLAIAAALIAVDAGQLARIVPDRWLTWRAGDRHE